MADSNKSETELTTHILKTMGRNPEVLAGALARAIADERRWADTAEMLANKLGEHEASPVMRTHRMAAIQAR